MVDFISSATFITSEIVIGSFNSTDNNDSNVNSINIPSNNHNKTMMY